MIAIDVLLEPRTIRELSKLSNALNRPFYGIALGMILKDLPRFKDRNRRNLERLKSGSDMMLNHRKQIGSP